MKNDFELVKVQMAWELEGVNVYPIGDVHFGSKECNMATWLKWKQMVLEDETGKVVIVGDMLENALKNSKGNSYEMAMQPREAKEFLYRELLPIKDRIIGAVQGNHCARSNQLTGDCPLYDVMCRLGIEDVYRENMAFIKLNVGRRKRDRQCSYVFTLAHGASRSKTERFGYSIDGVDVFVTGHTHSPESNFPAKIVVDTSNEVVRVVDYTHLVVPSFHDLGGYALKGLYAPKSTSKFPVIQLSGKEKDVRILWRS